MNPKSSVHLKCAKTLAVNETRTQEEIMVCPLDIVKKRYDQIFKKNIDFPLYTFAPDLNCCALYADDTAGGFLAHGHPSSPPFISPPLFGVTKLLVIALFVVGIYRKNKTKTQTNARYMPAK